MSVISIEALWVNICYGSLLLKVFQTKEEKHLEIPAFTHADCSGRLQTIYKETDARYYGLIESFCDITGEPIVLNTSFNENDLLFVSLKRRLPVS